MDRSPYRDLAARFQRIDRRHTRYRFDLDADVRWALADQPGLHLPPRLLTDLGVDADGLAAHPEAMALLQWGAGLEISRSFSALEQYLLDFVDDEHEVLGPTRSALLLYQEERKHIALFDRYAAGLRAARPEWVDDFEAAFAPTVPTLLHPYTRDAYPDAAAQHCFFWLKTLFFEEYTVYLHERLAAEADGVQPTWLDAHRAHRVEEQQHVVTDVAHLDALDLSDSARRACATAFWAHLEETFDLFLGVAASRRLVRAQFPEVADLVPDVPTRQLPVFRDVLGHRLFRATRRAAPVPAELVAEVGVGGAVDGDDDIDGAEVIDGGAAVEGPPLEIPEGTLADALDRAAATDRGIRWIGERGEGRETYGALRDRALRVLAALRARGVSAGDRIVVAVEAPERAVPVQWAAILGGIVPALVASGGDRREVVRARLGDPLVVDDDAARALLDEAEGCGAAAPSPGAPDELALIQFSSGSTGDPRGVGLTHRNVLANVAAIVAHLGGDPDQRFLSWLPLSHDMGLVGYHLLPVVLGAEQALMAPRHFLKRPVDWLRALSAHRAAVSACPSFGLRLVLDRVEDRELDGLDLSGMHCLLCGAEPVDAGLVAAFAARLAPHGLPARALTPAYGLAEGTLCLAARPPSEDTRFHAVARESLGAGVAVRPGEHRIVEVGAPLPGVRLRIVVGGDPAVVGGDPAVDGGEPVADGTVGEIEATGPNVTAGYVGDDPRPDDAFRGEWLRTGDLGFLRDGRLTVVGRCKDVIFVHGAKLHAHDVEAVAATVDGVHPRRVAAFGSWDPALGRDRLCLALCLRPPSEVGATVEAVQGALVAALGLRADVVLLVGAAALERTTSGKLRRHRIRARYEAGDLMPFAADGAASAGQREEVDRVCVEAQDRPALREVVRAAWAEALQRDVSLVGDDDAFAALGGTSLQAAHVHALLEERLGRPIPLRVLRDASTVAGMAAALGEGPGSEAVDAPAPSVEVRPGDVAIVGIGLRLPGVDDPDALWRLVVSGEHRFRPVGDDRWDHRAIGAVEPRVCPAGAFVDGLLDFDPAAFGLTGAEGAAVEPRGRLFLEAAAAALRDAGVGRGEVGVFVSQGESPLHARSYLDELARGEGTGPGRLENSTNNMVAARVARAFDLTGPAIVVQAACASSLAAVHQARRALQHGECEVAIAGGVEIIHSPTLYTVFAPSGVLSPSGRCRPLSADADGFVPGEGAAAVVLMRHEDAVARGERILAVIRGSAVTNDGRGFSAMAPSPAGQVRAARRALAEAEVDPASIGMIEAHGTATAVGDAVELAALRQVYGAGSPVLSASKSNLGHLLAASGVVGLIKATLAVGRGVVPPIAGVSAADHRHEAGPLRIVGGAVPWPQPGIRRAAVHSLGIGGTNAHLVLEQAPDRERTVRAASVACLSARSTEGLQREARALATWLDRHPGVDREATCAALLRRAIPERRARVARPVADLHELRGLLRAVADGEVSPSSGEGGVVVVFPGPGSQDPAALRTLADRPAFAAALERCEAVIRPRLGLDLPALLRRADEDIALAQPAVFALSWATWCWLRSIGLRPDGVLGHSAGEYAAAAAAGILSVEDALLALLARGEAMAAAPPGAMAAALAPREVAARVADAHDVELAAHNAPEQHVLSGAAAAVQAAVEALAAEGFVARTLPIPCAAHSRAMEGARPALARALEGLRFADPAMPIYSAHAGDRVRGLSAAHLVAQLREPVRFDDAVRAAIRDGARTFVEVGGAAVLGPAVEATAAAVATEVCATGVHRRGRGLHGALEAVAVLLEAGSDLIPGRVAPGAPDLDVALPPPSFDRRPLPMAFPAEQARRAAAWARGAGEGTAPGAGPAAGCATEGEPTEAERALFADHVADGAPIAPAAWMIERLFVARGGPAVLRDLAITAPASDPARWRVREAEGRARFETGDGDGWTAHAGGRWSDAELGELPPVGAAAGEPVEVEALYDALSAGGLAYGPTLRALAGLRRDGDVLWADLRPASPYPARWIDPSVLDGAFQALVAYLVDGPRPAGPMLGFAAAEVALLRPTVGPCRARIDLRHRQPDLLRVDITVVDALDRPCLVVRDFAARPIPRARPALLAVGWRAHPIPQGAAPGGRVALLADGALGLQAAEALLASGATVLGPLAPDHPAASVALRQAEVAIVVGASVQRFAALAPALAGGPRVALVVGDAPVAAMARAFGAEAGLEVRTVEGDAVEGRAVEVAALWQALSADVATLRRGEEGWQRPALAPVDDGEPWALPDGGRCWILGGSGGIGGAVAARLAAPGVRLFLSGRSDTPPERVAALAETGAEVVWVPVDLADPASVRAARDRVVAGGGLDALFHCAGVRDDGPLVGRDPARIEAVLAPKVAGVQALADALRDDPIGLVVQVSSLSALVPSPGQADYAAANAALDAAASVWRADRVVTVDCGPWAEVGMVADEGLRARLAAAGLPPMGTEEAVDGLLRAVGCGRERVVLARLGPDGARRLQEAVVGRVAPLVASAARPRAVVPQVRSEARAVATEAVVAGAVGPAIRAVVAEHLKVPARSLDAEASFAELGVDSLAGVEIARRLEARLGRRLHPTVLFEHPSLAALERHLRDSAPLPELAVGAVSARAPVPSGPLPGDAVEIRVEAWGVNFIDVLAGLGLHPVQRDRAFVRGHEVAGTVTAVGAEVAGISRGDRIVALVPEGGYAPTVRTLGWLTMPLPAGLSAEEGAAVLVTGLTALACIEDAGRVRPGERVLVHSASGATGTACVQLALHHGAVVYGTASTAEKRARVAELGARPLTYEEAPRVLREAGGAHVVVDALSGKAVEAGLAVLAPGGRFVELGAGEALASAAVDPRALFLAGQSLHGVNLAQLMTGRARLRELQARLAARLACGALRPAIGHVLPFERLDEAHALLRERRSIGKIVLTRSGG